MQVAMSSPVSLGLLVRRWPERRRVVLATAVALLVAVFAWRTAVDDPTLGVALLAVVPIVLLALELGQRGGLAAGLLGLGAVVATSLAGRPELEVGEVAVRGFVFLATGVAAGRFSDRMREAYAREARLVRSGLLLSEVAERDRLPELAVRQALAVPGVIGAVAHLDGLSETGAGRQEGVRTRLPMCAHGLRVGTLDVLHARSPEAEDLAALELLARQTAIVAEGLRLLDLDGERAALEGRLREVRRELVESRSGTGLLMRAEEADRRRAAEKLHEDLAQVLSAVLLGMRMLERGAPGERSTALQELHGQVAGVLRDVRDVARGLRPVVLDQLGLTAALEALARAAEERGATVGLHLAGLPPSLSDDVETAVYRMTEDAFSVAPADRVDVTLTGAADGVELSIETGGLSRDTLLALRARAESAGGTVVISDAEADRATVLRATMPAGG